MGERQDIPANPETPWEFLPHDDERRQDTPIGAEEAAMHLIGFQPVPEAEPEDEVVVHYLADEHPEIPDLTEPVVDVEHTADVQELLIRQHYMTDS